MSESASERLARFVGSWSGSERLAASPWAEAGEGVGTLRFAHVAGGSALALDYRETRDGEEALSAHGVFAVDPDGETVRLWWFDSFGFPPLEPANGRFSDGGSTALVLTRTSPRGTNRTTFALDAANDTLAQRVELKRPDADRFATLVDGEYRRA